MPSSKRVFAAVQADARNGTSCLLSCRLRSPTLRRVRCSGHCTMQTFLQGRVPVRRGKACCQNARSTGAKRSSGCRMAIFDRSVLPGHPVRTDSIAVTLFSSADERPVQFSSASARLALQLESEKCSKPLSLLACGGRIWTHRANHSFPGSTTLQAPD